MVDDPNRVPYTGQFGMQPDPPVAPGMPAPPFTSNSQLGGRSYDGTPRPPPPMSATGVSPYGPADAGHYWATHQNNSNDSGAFRSAAANEPAGWTAYGNVGGQFGVGYKDPNNGYHDPNGNFISNDTLAQISGQGVAGDANRGGNQIWGNSDQFFHNNFDVLAKNANSVAGGDLDRLQQDVYNRQYLINPLTAQADPSKQYFAGDPDYAATQERMMRAQAAGAMGRAAPTIDTSTMQPWQLGAQQSIGQMGLSAGNLNAQGYALNNAATGAGYQGQIGAAQGLQALGQMPAGPSVAEQAMRMQSAQNERTQAALAAGARGGNSALALNNAAANAAGVGGQLQQQLGIQRAQEDMANRQFSAQALGAAGSMYGQAAGTQIGALGGAASAYGNAGGLYGNAGALGLQGAGQMGNIATQNAGNALNQTQLNQTYGIQSQQLGADYMKSQLNATVQADANRTQNATNIAANRYANRDRSGEGTITGSAGGDKVLGAGASAVGTMLIGPMSDMRAKKDVAPAPREISDAFRTAGRAASDIGGTTVRYPQSTAAFPDIGAYSYQYKNPGALGAAPGTHYGPMAQELEQTPAGASVVGEDKKGRKFVDPGRLSMLTASEVAKQRKELDALKSMPGAITAPQVVYPQLGAPAQAIPDLHEAMAMGSQIRNTQVPYPTPAPVYRLGGV